MPGVLLAVRRSVRFAPVPRSLGLEQCFSTPTARHNQIMAAELGRIITAMVTPFDATGAVDEAAASR